MDENPTIESGVEAEQCSGCGYPLAADQRYCLNCGRRIGEPRVDYASYLAGERGASEASTEPVVAPVSAAPADAVSREPSPLIAVGGIALLGLMLLVGVLIGRGDGSAAEPVATPTVVQVDDGTSQTADTGTSASGGTEKVAAADGKSDKLGGGGGSGEEGSISNPEVASRQDLEDLQNQSGADYSEASQNLPDTIAIPGEPPPKDNEDPGGGTSATVIK
jgi:hypothetical protein